MRTLLVALLLCLPSLAFSQNRNEPGPPPPSERTIVRDGAALNALLGQRPFQLHWISWNEMRNFGRVDIAMADGLVTMRGGYEKDGDFIQVDGFIVDVDRQVFLFAGRIVTRVKTIYGGRPCVREGRFTFRKTGGRAFYRMQEMRNPCEGGELVDYIDVFPGR